MKKPNDSAVKATQMRAGGACRMRAFPAFLAAALALAPADRLQMADKMFAKGLYSDAAREYGALRGEKTIAESDIMFRVAECARMLGKEKEAIPVYEALLRRDIPQAMRGVALYRVACERNDAAMFLDCEKTDPKGRYATLARLKRALILSKGDKPEQRREATSIFLDLSLSPEKSVAEEATFAAASLAYGDKRWKEASILFGRLAKDHPDSERNAAARVPRAWSSFLSGRYTDCLIACGDSKEDDLAYLRGASLMALDRRDEGLAELAKYVELHPEGRYRAVADLPVQRARFDAAVKSGDMAAAVQAAKLAAAASSTPADALRLAWAHERAGAAAEAHAEYSRIAERWPNDPAAGEALFANALSELRAGNWSAGDLALEETLKRFPKLPRRNEALYWRGIAAVRLGHDAEGVARLKEALALGLSLDQSREANLLVADSDARAGRTAEAAKRYSELLGKGASDRMSAVHLAAVVKLLAEQGEWQAALTGARALTARSGDPAFVQVAASREGQALENLAMYDEAIAAYRRALAAKADTKEGAAASVALGCLEYRKGELDAAERTLADAIQRNAGPEGLKARAKAYRTLADVCRAKGEALKAKGYETVLKELFDDEG
jgi:tetratricopeptide (TPR) repeat protein